MFDRVKENWYKYDTLTAAELNQIDENLSDCLDIRLGESNSCYSDVNFIDSNCIVSTGSNLVWDANNFDLSAGNILVDGYLTGYSRPINYGYVAEAKTGNVQISSSIKQKIIRFTGGTNANAVLILPQIAGYEKIIINELQPASGSQNLTLTLHTAYTYANNMPGVVLPINRVNNIRGKIVHVCCDGVSIKAVNRSCSNYITNWWQNDSMLAPGTGVFLADATSYTLITGYEYTFYNCHVGDFVEVSYNANLINSATTGQTFIAVYYNSTIHLPSENEIIGDVGTVVNYKGLIPVYDATVTISLRTKYVGSQGNVKAPLSLQLKYIRN